MKETLHLVLILSCLFWIDGRSALLEEGWLEWSEVAGDC